MSDSLTPPSKELSHRLLKGVSYKDRLSAGRLLPPLGIIRGDVRSLEELHLLLAPDDRSLPGLNLSILAGWVERVIGDGELANALRSRIGNSRNYVEGCLKVYNLVGLRLEQAREAVKPEAE